VKEEEEEELLKSQKKELLQQERQRRQGMAFRSKSVRIVNPLNTLSLKLLPKFLHKTKLSKMLETVVKVLDYLLLPLSIIINLTMPDLNKKRSSFGYLYWGLILSVAYNALFAVLLVWVPRR
jgi:hypothetical protein